ncbi:MAG: hypothetical protein PHG14_06340 [Desulfobacter postgatei]|uniref:hypothetical protein n=1 Tax=Desulfobacter postgatei TaxID=2293 RepID=UPI0023F4BEB9|nr:hypothetical protein [Desulfobacter postgatei]MDD4273332.1 hypothetical protein [Desulfobacter postgatei]
MKKIEIKLCIGKPDDGSRNFGRSEFKPYPASFSRFVLPFAYQMVPQEYVGNDPPQLFYECHDTKNLSFTKRRKYLSRETGTILYDRSLWLGLSSHWHDTPWGRGNVTVHLRGRDLLLGMLPPRMVLFEAKDAFGHQGGDQQQNHLSVLKTGFLSVDLYFPEQGQSPELDDLLLLNEYFRYFGMPYDEHPDRFKKMLGNIPVTYSDTPPKKMADFDKTDSNFQNDASGQQLKNFRYYFERWANLLELPVKYEQNYYRFFPDNWSENARNLSYNTGTATYDSNWQILDDNRTVVWTAAYLEDGGKTLQKVFKPQDATEGKPLAAKQYGHWLKLLNIDEPAPDSEIRSHQSVTDFEGDWLDARTYKRWESSGTWYGFSYHSGAVLDRVKEGTSYSFAPFSSYYFDGALLLLYIRMSLFRFSAGLTQAVRQDKNEGTMRKQFRKIREEFLKFTILYQFPLLSNQQQNLEMYALNRHFFEIDDFFKEIKQEIDNMHDFLESVESNNLAEAAKKLTGWGLPLGAAGVSATILQWLCDFNIPYCWENECSFDWDAFIKFGIITVVSLVVWLIVNHRQPKGE